jgi:hypothetical protein
MLRMLEEALTFEDIIFFRSLAEKQIAESSLVSAGSWLGGVMSWAAGSWYGGVSEEEKLKLLEALHYDPDAMLGGMRGGGSSGRERGGGTDMQSTAPGETPAAFLTVTIKHGCVTMGLSAPENTHTPHSAYSSYDCIPFLELAFDSFDSGVSLFPDSKHVKVDLSLHDLEIYESLPAEYGSGAREELNLGTRYNKIVCRRQHGGASGTSAGGTGGGGSGSGGYGGQGSAGGVEVAHRISHHTTTLTH